MLYAAPGNPGIAEVADSVALDVADHKAVSAFCHENNIDLVVVGPEAPLVAEPGEIETIFQVPLQFFLDEVPLWSCSAVVAGSMDIAPESSSCLSNSK